MLYLFNRTTQSLWALARALDARLAKGSVGNARHALGESHRREAERRRSPEPRARGPRRIA